MSKIQKTNDFAHNFAVKLSIFEWHALLRELEEKFCVVNRNQHNAKVLYNAIASQLHGRPVDVFPKTEEPQKPQVSEKQETPQRKPVPTWKRVAWFN